MNLHKKKKRFNVLLGFIRWMSIIIFSVSVYFITLYAMESRSYRENSAGLTGIHDQYGREEKNPQTGKYKSMEALYEVNSDTVGYLTVEDTDATGPIVQTSDNEYYLNADFYKTKSKYGSRFADFRNKISADGPADQNTVIYGHYTDEKLLFAEINKYQDIDFYRAHPTLNLQSFTKSIDYKVFACFITAADPQYGEAFNYTRLNFEDGGDFMDFINQVLERSVIYTDVDITNSDKILTLSTCSRKFRDARFVLMARQIRPGENKSVNTAAAYLK